MTLTNVAFVTFIENLNLYFNYPVFLISVITLLLSFFVVPSFLAQIYCANIAFPAFISTGIYIGLKIFEPDLNNKWIWDQSFEGKVLYFHRFVRAWSTNMYIYFSTMTVMLAYKGYAKPFLFQKIMKNQ
ncbi:hypothetical protein L596_001337 [Steinernema carpocapsae]|uniref:Uncharacterized protein n=1 Tax=Steinernema carpocapsae TaxID=34508 RepID=A0A4U8UMZ9_STECR|nr:hypothetical protein L596_001337 [Steinernema carpocapsae]